jgi:MSHA pilin protein MshA
VKPARFLHQPSYKNCSLPLKIVAFAREAGSFLAWTFREALKIQTFPIVCPWGSLAYALHFLLWVADTDSQSKKSLPPWWGKVRMGEGRGSPPTCILPREGEERMKGNEPAKEEGMRKLRIMEEAGFTLMELLIVVLIVGILAAIAGPLYIGYTRDARMSEAKSIAGNVWTAMQSCAQANPGVACAASGQYARAGLSAAGVTSDAQWSHTDGTQTVTFNSTTNQYALSADLNVIGATGKVTDKLGVKFAYAAGSNPPGSMTCTTDGTNYSPC